MGALLDPFNRTLEDPDAEDEARYLTLGRGYADHVLLVVWTERDEDAIRIISARKTSPGEARNYED
ncbi:MAG: BrnT family toxin [Gammaproteobacteria bacterium]